MGIFNKTKDPEKEFKNALNDWCGNLTVSKKYKQKVKQHPNAKPQQFNTVKSILRIEHENSKLSIEHLEKRLDELLTVNINDLINLYNKKRIDTSTIHNQNDLNKALQKETVKKVNKYNPKEKGSTLKFTALIREERFGVSTDSKTKTNQIHGIIHDTGFEFNKTGVMIKTDLGERKVQFNNVISVDLDKSGYLHAMSNVNVRMRDGEVISIGGTADVCETIYNFMNTKWSMYQKNSNNNADELMKYAELYEKGLLTKEEFENKKKEIL